jgi:hypothetical protein
MSTDTVGIFLKKRKGKLFCRNGQRSSEGRLSQHPALHLPSDRMESRIVTDQHATRTSRANRPRILETNHRNARVVSICGLVSQLCCVKHVAYAVPLCKSWYRHIVSKPRRGALVPESSHDRQINGMRIQCDWCAYAQKAADSRRAVHFHGITYLVQPSLSLFADDFLPEIG